MTQAKREKLTEIMNMAWTLARSGAKHFGGSAKLYFAVALQIVWADVQKPKGTVTVYRKEIGNQCWMECVPLPQKVTVQGHLYLPGFAG